jgi:transcriptional regulator with XRE-family HTH domain
MKRLMNTIDAEREKKKITKTDLAKHLKVSPAAITHYFSGKNQMNLHTFLKIVKYIYGNEDREIMRKFLMSCDKKFNIEVMEWCYSNGEMELLGLVLKKDCKGGKSDASCLYELLRKRRLGEISMQDFYSNVDFLKMKINSFSEPHLHVLMVICSCYAYAGLYAYRLMTELPENTLNELKNIKSEYLRKSYELRLYEAIIDSHIKIKKVDHALELAERFINDEVKIGFPVQYMSICSLKAQALIFTDYQISVKYMKEIIAMFDGSLKEDVAKRAMYTAEHDFIKIVNRDFTDLYLDDQEEVAHFLASQDDEESRMRAMEIIDELIEEYGEADMYHKYFKALAGRDCTLMKEAERDFLIAANLFYADLPRRYIESGNL